MSNQIRIFLFFICIITSSLYFLRVKHNYKKKREIRIMTLKKQIKNLIKKRKRKTQLSQLKLSKEK